MRGIHVERVDVVAQRGGEVVELHGERAEPLRQRRDALVEQRRLVDQALRHAHAVERGRLGFAGQQGERTAGALEQLAGVPRPLAVDGQALVLPRLDARRLDLVHLVAQHVELALAVAVRAAQVVELARERAGARVRLGVRGLERLDLVGDRPVEQVELALELEQPRVLQLSVEGEAPPQGVLDGGGAAQQPVHPGSRPAAPRQLASHRQRLVPGLEESLHEGPVGARPDELVAALLPHEQPDRLRQQALARAGLARDDVEARRELQPGRGDEDQVVDTQFSEHRGGRRASPRRSGRTTLRSA